MIRIISGQRRGHKIDGPKGATTRPTSDLVREALFNILGATVESLRAIDLFAGTGALGLEALSRGAWRADFVERNRANVELIRRNIARLRYEDRTQVVAADAYRWARGPGPEEAGPAVVFLDPPYAEYENHPRRVQTLLNDLIGRLAPGSVLVVESSDRLDPEILPGPDLWDIRRYGETQLAFRTIPDPDLDPSPTDVHPLTPEPQPGRGDRPEA